MLRRLDNNALWNEAGKAGAILGGVSVGCLALKEWAGTSGIDLIQRAAIVILWVVEFFVCILVMKDIMISLRNRYENVKMIDTYKLGRRSALLSGLLLASAQAIFIMKMPQADFNAYVNELASQLPLNSESREEFERTLDNLPIIVFISQWVYCFLYGTVLASVMSRYIFLQKLFGGEFPPREDDTPDQQ